MLVLLKSHNPPRTRRASLQLKEDVAPPEHDPTIQVRREGYFKLELHTVLDGVEGEPDCPMITIPNGVETFIGKKVWVSPLLGDFTVDDFPEDWSFGNGYGGPTLINGVQITHVVFPWGTVLTPEQLYRLQEIYEGIPPGNPAVNTWRPFDDEGRLIL